MPNWTTPAGSNALLPALAVAERPQVPAPPSVDPWLSYWADNGSAVGELTLTFSKIDLSGGALSTSSTTAQQIPCPKSGGYWGDYDQMAVENNISLSAAPRLVRYVADSTAAACDTSNGVPQHVSGFFRDNVTF
jgi:hypothetical protein